MGKTALLNPATRQGVIFGFAWQYALLAACALTLGSVLSSCAHTQRPAFAQSAQNLADAVRRTETLALSPAQFNAFVESYVALVPSCQPYIPAAEVAYAALHVAGDLSVLALESLARRFDDVGLGPAMVGYVEPPCEALPPSPTPSTAYHQTARGRGETALLGARTR